MNVKQVQLKCKDVDKCERAGRPSVSRLHLCRLCVTLAIGGPEDLGEQLQRLVAVEHSLVLPCRRVCAVRPARRRLHHLVIEPPTLLRR
ncbi:hypothetical protein MAR_022259 [Mya arenaria]|uniref:Uncharacterized protein n=1 Tax=Mya arenaria TaxID=6604 RepID=A0ABY7DLQ8_MYAAR|nr:hypothetical protein MAR_022259 [Mya arenaria]